MSSYRTCSRCLYSTAHPFGIVLDDNGLCSGCSVHEEKYSLDWSNRFKRLQELVTQYKSKSTLNYDCIVPVTGSQDSYYTVYLVKEVLGLNPLLVSNNKYFNTNLGIYNLANLRRVFDCDIIFQNINPINVKKITRATLIELGSVYWPCIAGQTALPVQTAARHKIPLIIWGAHQGVEQVGMFSHEHEVEMSRRARHDHDLMGYEADDLLNVSDLVKEEDVWQYRYPELSVIRDIGIRGIYLSNYVPWDPKTQHEKMIEKYGYRSAATARTFDTYDNVDCYNYMGIHDYLKFVKHGYSKVLDQACREIRHGRMDATYAAHLVEKYQANPAKYVDKFCDWLGVNRRSLNFIINQHRNPEFWRPSEDLHGEWIFTPPQSLSVSNFQESSDFERYENSFKRTDLLDLGQGEAYINFGKGYG